MLKLLKISNFRGFSDHVLPFRARTWVVGRNNAGKTSLITALTLLSRVTNRWGRLTSRPVPAWLGDNPIGGQGVSPAINDMNLPLTTLFHRYGSPPSEIEAQFSNGTRVVVYMGPDVSIWATAFDSSGRQLSTHGQGATRQLPRIAVLPQVGPLQETEKVLESRYVRRSVPTSASLHFRNQLFYDLVRHDYGEDYQEEGEHFNEFKRLAEETWPHLQIRGLEWKPGHPGTPLRLSVRDDDFVAEAGEMGHGLQMWLQVMWFLARSQTADMIILDEPEVYTHADIQHRLVRVLESRPNPQVIVATHSVEILGDVAPEDVLVVDRSRPRSGFAGSTLGVQAAVERLGGIGSLPLTRLWTARRLLLLEGDDIDFLALFHKAFFPHGSVDIRSLPRIPVGGWGGFSYAVGGGMLLKNAAGEAVIPYCILDSDYHTLDECQRRKAEANRSGVELHIWQRKEIESYLLSPSAIQRVIKSRITTGREPTDAEIAVKIDAIAEDFRDDIIDHIAEEIATENRKLGTVKSNKAARARVAPLWATREGRWGLCKSKEVLSELSVWSKKEFGVSFAPLAVAYQIRAGELPDEVRVVVTSIEKGTRFPAK